MLFKFLTGKEIGHGQTGLILSQVGGLLVIFMSLCLLLPSRLFAIEDEECLSRLNSVPRVNNSYDILCPRGFKSGYGGIGSH